MTRRVLITGATGFVGTATTMRFAREMDAVRMAVRGSSVLAVPGAEAVVVGSMDQATDWRRALDNVDVVIHLAARVHVMRDSSADPLAEYRRVNVAGTLRLAEQAAASGARRLVFVSSVKVHGESGHFDEAVTPAPTDPYGVSKLEAEQGLRAIAAETGLEVVVLRPPLVYGPGVRANFSTLMRAIARGIPLPFGSVRNRRSLVALDNLVDIIHVASRHRAAANETFLVSDDHDLSTPELVRRLALAMGVRPLLLPVPPVLLAKAATLLGKREVADRLLGSLTVDCSRARLVLGWTPPLSLDEAMRRVVVSVV